MRIVKNLFREIKYYRDFLKIERNKKEIVFYAEDKSDYSYFEGLINYLTNQLNLNICYVTSDICDPILKLESKRIRTFYINSLFAFFAPLLDSKLLIMTMPDLHRFHIRRSLCGTHHVYIFHNIGSSFPVIRFGALFYYDTIFCVGSHHLEEIRKQEELYNLPKKNLVNFGYYRVEKADSTYRDYIQTQRKKEISSTHKVRILIGPSWGDNSILNFCGERLIRTLLESNYEVAVRPHPMTRKKTPRMLDALNEQFKNSNNYLCEENIASLDSVYRSDLLISDWSGLAFEYALGTERPVLFIDVPQKIVNLRYKELEIEPIDVKIRYRIGRVLKVNELERADGVITDILQNKDYYREEIKKVRTEFVYNFGNSSRAGADFIVSFIRDRLNKTMKNLDV